MPSFLSIMTALSVALAPYATAAPAVERRATCSTAFPSSFKIKEGSSYFEVQSSLTVEQQTDETLASNFYVATTSWDGDNSIPQLAYTAGGVDYLAWLENGSGYIIFHPTTVKESTSDSPVLASLEPDCTISLQPFEVHTDFYLQDCAGLIVIASSQGSDCVTVTASLAS